MRALTRAHSRVVSTSSAAITHCGCFLNSAEPGEMPNRAPRAPRYSRFSDVAQADVREQPGEQRLVDAVAGRPRPEFSCRVEPDLHAGRSWLCRSCHSRIRR